jgi:cell division transport system permease protein
MAKHHFRNSSFISAVSVALVLCMIGAECVLLLTAGALVTRTREKMTVTAVLTHDVNSAQREQLEEILRDPNGRYARYSFVSAEQALEDHINWLGEDPTEFLGYNPLTPSYEIHLKEVNTHPDSLVIVKSQLLELPYVDEVLYSHEMADSATHNLNNLLFILLVVALALLVISMVLIINTIHLQIYANRFLINTMTLVGATPWVTRRPFVLRNMLMGFWASLAALAVIAAGIYYVRTELDIVLFPMTMQNAGFIAAVVLGSGLFISFIASLIATGRYIRMDNNSLYEI